MRHLWKLTTAVLLVLFLGQWTLITELRDQIKRLEVWQ